LRLRISLLKKIPLAGNKTAIMLLHAYKITRILPCLADLEKIRVIAEISDEIHEVFPYLNATIKGCIYNHPALTLTVKKDEKLLTLHAHHITLAKIEDEKEAEEILGWLKNGTNCKKCGEPSCLAFAVGLVGQEVEITKCIPLFSDGYQEKRKVPSELLHAAGYNITS
jgi:ArsR family metal-binding transcriptional regulator